jgi:hypothetical protein
MALRIDTADLPAGVYSLRATDGMNHWSSIIIKRN